MNGCRNEKVTTNITNNTNISCDSCYSLLNKTSAKSVKSDVKKEKQLKTSIIMNIIIATFIAIIILLLYISFSAVFYSHWPKDQKKLIETVFDKVSSLYDSKAASVTGQSEAGP